MKQLKAILGDFLGVEFIKAGSNTESLNRPDMNEILASRKHVLVDNLLKQSKNNLLLIYVMTAMLAVLFGVCIYFAIYFKDDPPKLKFTIGGSLMGLIVIIRYLFLIWREKSKMDLLITLIPEITPQEVKEVIEIIYCKIRK